MRSIHVILLVVIGLALAGCAGPMGKAHHHAGHEKMMGQEAEGHVCGPECTHAKGEHPKDMDMGQADMEHSDGNFTACPVSGEMVEISDETPSAEYNGQTYYFCCTDCKAKFEADPETYIGG